MSDLWQDDSVLGLFIATFAGRDDLYVANAAEVIREPLTPAVVRFAREHNYPVSAYLGTPDGETHVGGIDFDRDDGRALAIQTAGVMRGYGLHPLVVESRRGAHVWLHTNQTISVGLMRKALKEALWDVDMALTTDDKVEVFPKHGTGDLAVGALRLPLLPHQRTQCVYDVITEDGDTSTDLGEVLLNYEASSAIRVVAVAEQGRIPSEYPRRLNEFYGYTAPRDRDWGEAPSASEVLISMGAQGAKPGGTVRCPKHEDRRRSLTIFKDDQRVYCGAPSCVLHGGGRGVGSVVLSKMN